MLWIKRNLFLVGGGVAALALLGLGGFYFWTSYQKNNSVEEELKQARETLKHLYELNPFPNSDNIGRARAELQRVQTAISATQKSFSPLAYQRVKGKDFAALLLTTIDELQKKADQSGVTLPLSKGYAFSFAEQQKRLQLSEGSFPTLAEQLAEIKAISTILFEAKINKLSALRRGRVTTDDPPAANDYHEMKPERLLASGAVACPYIVEFNSFSTELAAVLEGFYKSPNGLLVKAVEAKPVEEAGAPGAPPPYPNPGPVLPPGTPPSRRPVQPVPTTTPGAPRVQPRPGAVAGTAKPPFGAGATASGEGFKTVLDEKMLKITLWVDVLKPPAK